MASKKTKTLADAPVAPPVAEKGRVDASLLLLLLALLPIVWIRIRLLGFPLERDEGEYAYFGQLLLDGVPPFQEAYNMKLPGASLFYALFMFLFGETPTGIHLGLLLANLGSVLLLYYIGKKLIGPAAGAYAGAAYALLSLAPGIFGFAAHATHYIVLCALAGWAALLRFEADSRLKWLLISGFCFGLAFVVKQHAVFLLLFGGLSAVWLVSKRYKGQPAVLWSRLALFKLALLAPYLLVLLLALTTGTFQQFWHWTVAYAQQYAGIVSLQEGKKLFFESFARLSKSVEWLWYFGALGLVALVAGYRKWTSPGRLLLFTLLSALCVLPGWYFRVHYFVVFLPALALLIGMAFSTLGAALKQLEISALKVLPVLLFAGGMTYTLVQNKLFFFDGDLRMLCAMTYGTANPFLEAKEIARFIASNTKPDDRIAVLGSEPEICFYSKRRSASGYIYMYPLVENQVYSAEMQRNMIAETERNHPAYLVYVDSPFSWLTHPDAPQDVFRWYQQYKQQFNLVGIIDMNPSRQATYVWRDQIATYTGQGKNRIWIYERKPAN